ncbi:hypothetical protein [Achromobacter sp. AONIH1]|uniref:hypothetical protein n=1 Tax=Achromobacter sp. AONIH1 TaxID=1758194 RepID=UPI000CD1B2FD|nr:hypothetical protein [Achromobacter sp. AONIH1]AUT49013.1 hypothetical protein C2U31_25275 [Achromobacter sp. AONIH1]
MTKPKPQIQLGRGEHIVAAVPEYTSGPDWTNSPLWVYIDAQGKLCSECTQPQHQTVEQRMLFALGAQISRQLIASVEVRREEK